jgi:flagellar hook-basal body complex protein FliE
MLAAMNAMSSVGPSASSTGGQVDVMNGTRAASSTTGTAATPFSGLFSEALGQVSALENQARTAVEGLMIGSGVDIHQAMIASEKANMAFELALAVRNKAVQAYQSVMGMQF